MASKYNHEGCGCPVDTSAKQKHRPRRQPRPYDPTAYAALTAIERREKAGSRAPVAKRAAGFRPIVYICSPYSKGDVKVNVENAKKYSRFAVDNQYLPITPHIYFTQFMDDNVKAERKTAIHMNFVLMSKCSELWVFGEVISKGMKAEIRHARDKGMRIRFFTEECEEK